MSSISLQSQWGLPVMFFKNRFCCREEQLSRRRVFLKGLTSWLLFVMFIVIVLLSHLVSWDRCSTWLYRFLIPVVFLTLVLFA